MFEILLGVEERQWPQTPVLGHDIIHIWVPNFFLNSRQWQYQLLTIMWNKGNFMLTGVKIAKASFILWNRVKEMNTCDPQIHSRVYILEGAGPWAPEHWPWTSSTVTIAKKRKLETTQISPAEEWIHKLCFIHDNATQQWKRRNCSMCSLDNLGTSHWGGKGRGQKDIHKITQLKFEVWKHAN